MVESDITTKIEVITETDELDKLPTDGPFEGMQDIIDDLKSKIEDGASDLAKNAADQLKQYEQTHFNRHDHPYETGTGANAFVTEEESDKIWIVDNEAENDGFPYMVTDDLGNNPGRKLPPHPFVADARDDLESDIDRLGKEAINL